MSKASRGNVPKADFPETPDQATKLFYAAGLTIIRSLPGSKGAELAAAQLACESLTAEQRELLDRLLKLTVVPLEIAALVEALNAFRDAYQYVARKAGANGHYQGSRL